MCTIKNTELKCILNPHISPGIFGISDNMGQKWEYISTYNPATDVHLVIQGFLYHHRESSYFVIEPTPQCSKPQIQDNTSINDIIFHFFFNNRG